MRVVRREPCSACPYRRDAPSGLWSEADYRKLPPYDGETFEQPPGAFACHATPEHLCHGWAVVGGVDLLGLRLVSAVVGEPVEVPPPVAPLFASHTEAAEHGLRDLEAPDDVARRAAETLRRKYARLR